MFVRQILTGLRLLIVFTVVLGIAYPALVWAIGQAAFPRQANGSLLTSHGKVQGSTLIGQTFAGDSWFQPRPSVGKYDAEASAGSNLGPSSPVLLAAIAKRRQQVAKREGVDPSSVPPDALTASASGLDAFISPAYARLQQARVARVRGLPLAQVQALVHHATSGRSLGFLGEPRVDVVTLNAGLTSQG